MGRICIALAGAIIVMSASAAFAAGAPTGGKKLTQAEANAACKAEQPSGRNAGGIPAYMACVRRKMAGQ